MKTKTKQQKVMIKFNKWLVVACVATLMSLGMNSLQAQEEGGGRRRGGGQGGGGGFGGGNFDPAEFQARRLERIRENLEVTKDEEWKVIEGRVTKVMDAQRGVIGFTRLGGFGRGGRGGGGGGRFGGEPVPEVEGLQKAIEDKASAADLKTALEKFRAARKAKQDELKKAQDELKKVLSARQEAAAVMDGLLE